MAEPAKTNKREGLSQELDTALNHLGNLLRYLPESLPLASLESVSDFSLDEDDVRSEGIVYALNQQLEILFETHTLPVGGNIQFKERGPHWKLFVSFL